jgi:hypothetical protein
VESLGFVDLGNITPDEPYPFPVGGEKRVAINDQLDTGGCGISVLEKPGNIEQVSAKSERKIFWLDLLMGLC